MPLKIAYFLDSFYPQVNGVLVSAYNTMQEMANRGHEIAMIAPRPLDPGSFDEKKWMEEHGVRELFLVKGKQAFFYPDFIYTKTFSWKIFHALRDFGVQITHFHSPWTLGMMGIRMAGALKVPSVGTFHTFFAEPEYIANAAMFRFFGLDRAKWFQRVAWKYNNNLFYKRCTRIVACGEYPRQALLEQGFPEEGITVVYNGLDLSRYAGIDPRKPVCPLPVALEPDKRYIVYTGRLSVEKSLRVLADAVKIVADRREDVRWLVIGHGPDREALEEYVRSIGLEGKTIFTGAIPNEVLMGSGLLGRCALFATASKTEAQPVSILEAMLFGLPVVGVASHGTPDLLRYDNGILVPPDNPQELAAGMLGLLEDPELCRRLSQNARRTIDRFDIRKTTGQMEALYQRVIADYRAVRDSCRQAAS